MTAGKSKKGILIHKIERFISENIAYSCLVIALVVLYIFMDTRIDYLLDSDMTSDLILAKILNEEGGILTSNWVYSTDLRVLNTQIVFAPLFSLFSDWHVVRVVGSMILYVIMILCYYYLCRQLQIRHLFAWTAPFLILPVSECYLIFALEFAYYVVYISISFASLGIVISIIQHKGKKKNCLRLIILGALSFISGMNGLRQLLVLYIPLLITAIILYLWKHYFLGEENEDAKYFDCWSKLLLCSVDAAICSFIGFIINDRFLSKLYQFKNWDGIKYAKYSTNRIAEVLNGFLYSLGFKEGEIFSFATIHNGICILLLILIIASFRYLVIVRWGGENNPVHLIMGLFPIVALAVFTGLFIITDMHFSQRYNLPVLIMVLPAVGIFLSEYPMQKKLRISVCILLYISITCCSLHLMLEEEDKKPELHTIAAFLEKDYHEGYATYWNGPILTELTDNKIKIRALGNGNLTENVAYIDQLHVWLRPVDDEYTVPEGEFFVLLSNDEAHNYSFGRFLEEYYSDHVIYKSAQYIIYEFENYDEIDFEYEMTFQNGKWLINGTDIDGIRTLNLGGISYGPYITLKKAGIYQVVIEGTGLDGADIRITTDNGKKCISWNAVSYSDEKFIIEFIVDEQVNKVECCIENVSADVLELKNITFRRSNERNI